MMLEVKNGNFSYNTEEILLKDISFMINKGEIFTILGPNGVGKTTLLKCATPLLKWEEGTSFIDNVPLKKLNTNEIWKKIGYVPQGGGSVFSYTVLDMVLMGRAPYLNIFSLPSKQDIKIAKEALELVGIPHLAKRSCSRISGGEMQLVLIARALTSEPSIMVLDEPESHLDFKNQLLILEILKKIAGEKGISCIINTHFPSHALQISDKTLLLGKNRKYIFGKTKDIITEDNLKDYFDVNVKIVPFKNKGQVMKTIVPLSY